MRSVRSAPPFGAVRVYAKLSLSLTKRGEGRTAYGTERSGRSASERMFAECAEPKRSGVEKPWCRSRATSGGALRSAPCSWAQCAFERSRVLLTVSRILRKDLPNSIRHFSDIFINSFLRDSSLKQRYVAIKIGYGFAFYDAFLHSRVIFTAHFGLHNIPRCIDQPETTY